MSTYARIANSGPENLVHHIHKCKEVEHHPWGAYDNAEAVVRNTTLLTQKNGLVQGFWYSDYGHIFERALDAMSGWTRSGELQEFTDVAKGFESVPRSVRGIFTGENLGKQLVELS